jgi:RNA polymerase sigma-70 factor (ECF subfamily)
MPEQAPKNPAEDTASQVRLRQGQLSFEQVYEEFFPFVWRTARRMGVREGSLDDVCQDVFIAVHRRLPEFEGRSSVKTWLFGFVLNVVQVHHRTLRRKSVSHRAVGDVMDPDLLTDQGHGPHEQASRNEAASLAHAVLDQLDEEKRVVFILAELEEMSATEIADAVGANVNTVYARLRAARQQFALAASRLQAKDGWRL